MLSKTKFGPHCTPNIDPPYGRIRLNHLAFTALCEYLRLKIVEDIVLCVSCKLFGSESFHYTMFQMVMTELKEMVIGAISKSTIF